MLKNFPQVGDRVILSAMYKDQGDAENGPLAPGEVGTVVEVDSSTIPYRVLAPNGKQFWYRKKAVTKLVLGAPPVSPPQQEFKDGMKFTQLFTVMGVD